MSVPTTIWLLTVTCNGCRASAGHVQLGVTPGVVNDAESVRTSSAPNLFWTQVSKYAFRQL